MKYQKVLVTGGTGFIGSHLVERLIKNGRTVRVLALPHPFEPIENENIDIISKAGAEVVYGNLIDYETLYPAVKEIDCVFHLGAISRPMKIPKQLYYDTNVKGTENILTASIKAGVSKIIHISTVSVLGTSPDGHPLKENEFQPEKTDYGLSKRQGEKLALELYHKTKIPLTVIRPPLTYGPRCYVRKIMFDYTKKRLFPLFNGGKAKMEFCYVDNLIDAILLAEQNEKAIGEVFNITDGQSYSLEQVIKAIANELGVKPPLLNLPSFIGVAAGYFMEFASAIMGKYPPFSNTAALWMSRDMNVYDCNKAKKILGYSPSVSLEEGIHKTAEWFYKRGDL
jgi:UDP-glucose 4-epimerase